MVGYAPVDQQLSYYKNNLPCTIVQGGYTRTYEYDANNQRDYSVLTVSSSTLPFAAGRRYYFDDFERNINTGNGAVTDLDYIFADGRLVALVRTVGGKKTCYGVTTDHLGSLMCLYTGEGIVQKFSYDAWGNRRDPLTGVVLNNAELASASSITTRGYTGHEHIDEMGLIHMNARLYDSRTGLFVSIDPQAGSYLGTYPYTYCGGDPMNGVDPTGEDYWSTSDPNVIYDLWKYYNDNKGIGGYNFQGWYQMSDKDFLAAYDKYGEQALTYNDQTSTLYTSYGRVENGEVVIYGKQIKLSQSSYRPVEDNEYLITGEPPLPGFSAFKWASLPNWTVKVGKYKYTETVARHFRELVKRGPYKGELSRPFMSSPLTVQEIMQAGKGIPDAAFKGGFNWRVPGVFRGSQGIWELGINPKTNIIYHFNFTN